MCLYGYTTPLPSNEVQIGNWWGFLHWFLVKIHQLVQCKGGKGVVRGRLETIHLTAVFQLFCWTKRWNLKRSLFVREAGCRLQREGGPVTSSAAQRPPPPHRLSTCSPTTYLAADTSPPLSFSFHLLSARFFLATSTRPFFFSLLFLSFNPSLGCPHLRPKAE